MKKQGKILVVDDNAGIRSALKILLPMHFDKVELLSSPVDIISRVESFKPDAVLLDMNFKSDINSGNEGLYYLGELKQRFPSLNVILFTAYADIQLAVEGMKRGAFDFIVKPWKNEQLIQTLSNACGVKKEKSEAKSEGSAMYWGSGEKMTAISRDVAKIAPTDATVLITGENGTGKDVLAREIHSMSQRASSVMVSVDAGAIPETLFEDELFGHVKGAFTDARSDHAGKFEQAQGGTLFLDEIGNIPLQAQAKLLRVLQNRTVTRLGDTRPIPVDIRLICATNMNLEDLVSQGRFREDLYYRINTFHIELPPLRERKDEIIPLAQMFLEQYAEKYHRSVTSISEEGKEALLSGAWNGNIRELQNCMEKAVILSEGDILGKDDFQISGKAPESHLTQTGSHSIDTLEEAEEKAVRAAMDEYKGNLSLVAKALGISRPTLYGKLKKYGI